MTFLLPPLENRTGLRGRRRSARRGKHACWGELSTPNGRLFGLALLNPRFSHMLPPLIGRGSPGLWKDRTATVCHSEPRGKADGDPSVQKDCREKSPNQKTHRHRPHCQLPTVLIDTL